MGFRAVLRKDTEDPHWLYTTPLKGTTVSITLAFCMLAKSVSHPAPHVQEWMAGSLWTLCRDSLLNPLMHAVALDLSPHPL